MFIIFTCLESGLKGRGGRGLPAPALSLCKDILAWVARVAWVSSRCQEQQRQLFQPMVRCPASEEPWHLHPQLKTSPVCCSGRHCLQKYPGVLLYLSVKPFLFLFFALVVSFSLTPTKRQTHVLIIPSTVKKKINEIEPHLTPIKCSTNIVLRSYNRIWAFNFGQS